MWYTCTRINLPWTNSSVFSFRHYTSSVYTLKELGTRSLLFFPAPFHTSGSWLSRDAPSGPTTSLGHSLLQAYSPKVTSMPISTLFLGPYGAPHIWKNSSSRAVHDFAQNGSWPQNVSSPLFPYIRSRDYIFASFQSERLGASLERLTSSRMGSPCGSREFPWGLVPFPGDDYA